MVLFAAILTYKTQIFTTEFSGRTIVTGVCSIPYWYWHSYVLFICSLFSVFPVYPLEDDVLAAEKRGLQYLPVVFYCRKKSAVCLNGGRGPNIKLDKKKKKPLCVCMCPAGFTAPQCARRPKSNYS